MNDVKLRGAVFALGTTVLAIFLLWLIGEYVLVCFLPFITAYLISLAVRPVASFVSRRFGVGRRFVSAFMVLILISAIFLFLSWLASLLIGEIEDVSKSVAEKLSHDDNVVKQTLDFFSSLREKIPFVGGTDDTVRDSLYDAASSFLQDSLSKLASFAASVATSLIGRLPRFVLGTVTAIISTFYLCTDKGALGKEAECFLGESVLERVRVLRARLNTALSSYFKSYLLLMLITFAELLLGFVILGIKNALLAALIVALIDLLPVLGSGAVMIPWALVELFITKNVKVGTGLLVMVAVMYLVRQFAEPRIVGGLMGIHPLLSLFAVYVGFVLFGFAGVLIFPILLYLVKAVLSDGKTENAPDGA